MFKFTFDPEICARKRGCGHLCMSPIVFSGPSPKTITGANGPARPERSALADRDDLFRSCLQILDIRLVGNDLEGPFQGITRRLRGVDGK